MEDEKFVCKYKKNDNEYSSISQPSIQLSILHVWNYQSIIIAVVVVWINDQFQVLMY